MKLGKLLAAYMASHGVSFRTLAKEIGMDHSALHRLVHGNACEGETLVKLLVWLLNK